MVHTLGWIQGRCSSRFAPEALERLHILRPRRRQEFERDEPTQSCILCLVYDAHASLPNRLDDAVVTYALTWREGGAGLGCGYGCFNSLQKAGRLIVRRDELLHLCTQRRIRP